VNRNQQGQALITAYVKLFDQYYGFKPTINRFRVKWGMMDVIDSVGYDRAMELLKYYFSCETDHSPERFMGSFDRLESVMVESEKDAARRAALRAETQRRVEEFEQRSSSNQRTV
jgi:hypothetical protein